ncbi:ABC transporter permease [Leptolyngbya sp. FACHB-541]|uniref:ABC transporter permease n=1 Tax=Leptolyngbya sp. FACHB-541 TaxID=2692810 RepID=UPI0016875D2A|nr:ABC transporter permease [Leptolyngbya sp. FACHB-541]
MTPQKPGALLSGSARPTQTHSANPFSSLGNFIYKTLTVTELEVRKLRHDPTQLMTRAVQPSLWLLIFGQVFSRIRAIPTGDLPYLDFMTPGILAQSILFMAIFNGLSVIWERDLGILHKLLVSPTPRAALVVGKAIAAGVRSLSQVILIYILASLLGVGIDWNPFALLGVLIATLLGATLFSTLSLIVACIVKTHERFMGIGQFLTMPLFFASNAIYPIEIMPHWLQVISYVNPLTYLVDVLRSLMLTSETSTYPIATDLGILLAATAFLTMVCARLYPKLVT